MSKGKSATTNETGTQIGTSTGTTNGTSITGVSPYSLARPGLQTGLRGLMDLYNKGTLAPRPYTSPTTAKGISSLITAANNGVPALKTGVETFRRFAKGAGGVNSGGQTRLAGQAITAGNDAVGSTGQRTIGGQAIDAGGNAVDTGAQTDIYSRSMGPSYSEDNLAGVARGDMLSADDPNFERLLSRSTDAAALAAKQAAGARGRYGGDFAQENVARAVGDTEAEARYKRYGDERSRQVEANSLMDAMRQAGLGLGLNASNSASSIEAANRDRVLSGLGLGLNAENSASSIEAANRDRALSGINTSLNATNSATAIEAANKDRQLGAAGALPGAVDSLLNPSRELIKAGQLQEGRADDRAAAPANNLMALLQALGIATPYGTTATSTTGTQTGTTVGTTNGTATTKQPSNLLSQLLGGGLGLASLLNV